MQIDYNVSGIQNLSHGGGVVATKLAKTRALTVQQIEAARLVAEGGTRRKDIAAQVGVQEVTLYKWLRRADFQDQIDDFIKLAARATRARVLHDSQQIATALTDELLRRIDAKELSDVNWKTLLKEAGEWLGRYLEESGVGNKKGAVSLTQINIGNEMTLRDIMERRRERPAEVIEVEATFVEAADEEEEEGGTESEPE